ncbi:MAG: hypothetical protein WCJ64_23750 [Rhodospirillaceae bacterium]
MTTLQAEQILVESLVDRAVEAAAGGTLNRKHLDELTSAFRAASAAGASAVWLGKLQERMERILAVHESSRTATALKADSFGRRRAVRITSPPLTVAFADGQVCSTIDWSTYGILVSGFRGAPLVGEQITATVTSAVVEGGGAVTGRVVLYSAASGQLAIEFLRPSLSVQVMKVRMMRSGLL